MEGSDTIVSKFWKSALKNDDNPVGNNCLWQELRKQGPGSSNSNNPSEGGV